MMVAKATAQRQEICSALVDATTHLLVVLSPLLDSDRARLATDPSHHPQIGRSASPTPPLATTATWHLRPHERIELEPVPSTADKLQLANTVAEVPTHKLRVGGVDGC